MPHTSTNTTQTPLNRVLGRVWRWLTGFADGAYIDRHACDAAMARMHRRDAIGDKLHLFFGLGAMVCLFGPVTMTEWSVAPLTVFFFVRVINTYPVWIHGFGQPLMLSILALVVWMFAGLIWSPEPLNGLAEIGRLRWFLAIGLLFPIIEHRTKLIYAMCIGLAMGQIGQVLDAFDGFGIGPIAALVENHPGRIAGWWHPVIAGDLLVAAMGLHLPAAAVGRGRTRAIGLLGLTLAGVGVLATGTRGAWVAGVLLLMVGGLLVVRVRRVPMRRVATIGVLVLVAAGISGVVLRDSIMIRINETRAELAQISRGELDSYSGLRVRMARQGVDAFTSSPIVGVGTGGYERWSERRGGGYGAHAHNSALHIAATLGLVGLALWALVLFVALRCAWRWGQSHAGNPYALGPLLGIVGLVLASISDSVHINLQSMAMLGMLVGLCPAYAPNTPAPVGTDKGGAGG